MNNFFEQAFDRQNGGDSPRLTPVSDGSSLMVRGPVDAGEAIEAMVTALETLGADVGEYTGIIPMDEFIELFQREIGAVAWKILEFEADHHKIEAMQTNARELIKSLDIMGTRRGKLGKVYREAAVMADMTLRSVPEG